MTPPHCEDRPSEHRPKSLALSHELQCDFQLKNGTEYSDQHVGPIKDRPVIEERDQQHEEK